MTNEDIMFVEPPSGVNGLVWKTKMMSTGYLASGFYFTQRMCLPDRMKVCNVIHDYELPAFASFDVKNDLLKPLEIDPWYWSNSVPPSALHPVANSYDIIIEGITSYGPDDSWCSDCEQLNRTLKYTINKRDRYKDVQYSNHDYCDPNTPYAIRGSFKQNYMSQECIDNAGDFSNILDRDDTGYLYKEYFYKNQFPHINYGFHRLIDMHLCTSEIYETPCLFHAITIDVGIGLAGDTTFDESVYPSGGIAPQASGAYIYYNRNKAIENRPDLYIIALTTLHGNMRGNPGYLSDSDPDNDNIYAPVYFKTIIAPYTGDYIVSSGRVDAYDYYYGHDSPANLYDTNYSLYYIQPVVYSGDCMIKPDHGDYDGRNLSFTVRASDRIHPSVIGAYNPLLDTYDPVPISGYSICNMDNITIQVNARPPNIMDYDEQGIPSHAQIADLYYRDMNTTVYRQDYQGYYGYLPVFLPYSGIFAKGYGILDIGDLWSYDGGLGGYYSIRSSYPESGVNGPYYLADEGLGLLPRTIILDLEGIDAYKKDTPRDKAHRDICYDTDKLNGRHILHMDLNECNFYLGYQFPEGKPHDHTIPRFIHTWSKRLDDTVCCECNEARVSAQVNCINQIHVILTDDLGWWPWGYSDYNHPQQAVASGTVLYVVLGNGYGTYYYNRWNVCSDLDQGYEATYPGSILWHEFHNPSGEALDYRNIEPVVCDNLVYAPFQSGIHNFDNAKGTITFGNISEIRCNPTHVLCQYCYDGRGPDRYSVTLPALVLNPDILPIDIWGNPIIPPPPHDTLEGTYSLRRLRDVWTDIVDRDDEWRYSFWWNWWSASCRNYYNVYNEIATHEWGYNCENCTWIYQEVNVVTDSRGDYHYATSIVYQPFAVPTVTVATTDWLVNAGWGSYGSMDIAHFTNTTTIPYAGNKIKHRTPWPPYTQLMQPYSNCYGEHTLTRHENPYNNTRDGYDPIYVFPSGTTITIRDM